MPCAAARPSHGRGQGPFPALASQGQLGAPPHFLNIMLIYLHSYLLMRATSGQLEAFHSLQYEVTGAQAQLWGFGHLLWGLHLDQAPLGAD